MLLGSTMYVGRERLMLRDKVVYEKKKTKNQKGTM